MTRSVIAGAVATVLVAFVLTLATGSDGPLLFLSVAAFGLSTLVVVSRVGAHHPFDRFGPANTITVFRLSLLAAMIGLVGEPRTTVAAWSAIACTAAVALLDGADGWVARQSRLASRFGARFDMETDAMVILVLSVLVWRFDKAGAWVLACGLMRYGFVAAGWLMPWMAAPLRSTFRGKTAAVVQLAGLGAALIPPLPVRWSVPLASATLAVLIWSFALDIAWLWRGGVASPGRGHDPSP